MGSFRERVLEMLDGRRGVTMDSTVAELVADAIERLHNAALAAAVKPWREALDKEIADIEGDERFHYEPALVEINAPLALIQVNMKARHSLAKRLRALLKPVCQTCKGTRSVPGPEIAGCRYSRPCPDCTPPAAPKCPTCGDSGKVVDSSLHITFCPDCTGRLAAVIDVRESPNVRRRSDDVR